MDLIGEIQTTHKKVPPFRVESAPKSIAKKILVANRDIDQGEVILEEDCLIHFNTIEQSDPKISQCVTCGKKVVEDPITKYKPGLKVRIRCSMCSWPVCGPICEKAPIHVRNECNVLLENDVGYPEEVVKGRGFDMIARAYGIRCQNSLIWNDILNIMPFDDIDEYDDLPQVVANIKREHKSLTPIMSTFPHFVAQHEPVIKEEIETQLTILGRRVGFKIPIDPLSPAGPGHMHLYKQSSYLTSNCVPNCLWDISWDFKIRIRASIPIRRDELITIDRENFFCRETRDRQKILKNRFKKYCNCKLCSDTTEFGTFQSGIRCQTCRSQTPEQFGYFYPTKPNNLKSKEEADEDEWECSNCHQLLPRSSFIDTLIEIKVFIQEFRKEPSRRQFKTDFFNFLKEYSAKILHPNHWLIQQVIDCFITNSGNVLQNFAARKLGVLTPPEIEELVEQLNFMLEIFDKIYPGLHYERVRYLLLLADSLLILCKEVCDYGKIDWVDDFEVLVQMEERLEIVVRNFGIGLLYWRGKPLPKVRSLKGMVEKLGGKLSVATELLERVRRRLEKVQNGELTDGLNREADGGLMEDVNLNGNVGVVLTKQAGDELKLNGPTTDSGSNKDGIFE